MTPLSLLVAAVATLNYAAAKNCDDLINSCEGYNSGGDCFNDQGDEVYLAAQNPDYVIQAFRYYGIPIIDTAVWLIAVILLIIHTKNKAHKTALGGIMCILSLIMSLIGKSVVFSVAQRYGLLLEYIPLFGIYAFGTKGSAAALASYGLVLVYMLTGVIPEATEMLSGSGSIINKFWLDFDAVGAPTCNFDVLRNKVIAEYNYPPTSTLPVETFGCFCIDESPPPANFAADPNFATPFYFTPRWGYYDSQWVHLLVVLTYAYAFAACLQFVTALLKMSDAVKGGER